MSDYALARQNEKLDSKKFKATCELSLQVAFKSFKVLLFVLFQHSL